MATALGYRLQPVLHRLGLSELGGMRQTAREGRRLGRFFDLLQHGYRSERQLLVLGLTAEKYCHEAQHGKAGHDSRGIGKPTKLHDEQPDHQRPEAGEHPPGSVQLITHG